MEKKVKDKVIFGGENSNDDDIDHMSRPRDDETRNDRDVSLDAFQVVEVGGGDAAEVKAGNHQRRHRNRMSQNSNGRQAGRTSSKCVLK